MLCIRLREWIWWASKARNVLENNIQNSIINILVTKPNALYVNIHQNWVVFYVVGILVYIQTLNLKSFNVNKHLLISLMYIRHSIKTSTHQQESFLKKFSILYVAQLFLSF